MTTQAKKRILIVGGVAGGASAAARARRLSEDADIVLFERGRHVSFANCGMPYYIGGAILDRDRLLVQTADGLKARYGIEVRVQTEVLRVDRARKLLVVRGPDGAEKSETYDALILSPGAQAIRPPLPGGAHPRVFTLRSLADMDAIKTAVDGLKGCRALIMGGGYIGLEMAEAFRARGLEVTLVELSGQVFAPADPEMVAPVHRRLRDNGVDLRLGVSVTSLSQADNGLKAALSTGDELDCALALQAIGLRPETALAREAGLALGPSGGIAVDAHMRTSDPSIYAVGDAVEVSEFVTGNKALIPLAGPASRQGRIAADNALGRDSSYRGTQGTAICKVFDLAVGVTGLNEKTLKRLGRAYEKVHIHPTHHAGYYPGAAQMSLKILFDPKDGLLLGAQAVGLEGVDKRLDVLAVALRAKMTVRDLRDLELCYAPPYGSAKDPVNCAGFAATNALEGDVRLWHAETLPPRPDQVLLDARTAGEFAAGSIPGALNVPVDDLRARLGDLPKDRELLVFCQVGLRGYLACLILSQNGFVCRNLSGGYQTYQATVSSPAASERR
ncbi:MAG TPA: CoA-disulfide reductase [Elusimicrobia bacterium]|nr:MAG: CoA-disulfide reductase [Elusimicrobia bacterium GWA2_66_18]HAZ07484.1 CoA-disulfide reductase [Elusimicrobiota bacterium]